MTMSRVLFLDRDGVINRQIDGHYIRRWEEWEFLPGVMEGLAALRPYFDYVFVVTNQQGMAKGLLRADELHRLHYRMRNAMASKGITIDRIYFCPHTEESQHLCRKPWPGMALWALAEYPDIHLSRSVMIGDKESDMDFARQLQMPAIWFGPNVPSPLPSHVLGALPHWQAPQLQALIDEIRAL